MEVYMAGVLAEVPTILNVGFTGFGFLLMYLAYGLLKQATNPNAAPQLNTGLIHTFLIVSLVMTAFGFGSETFKQWLSFERKPVTVLMEVSPAKMPDAETKVTLLPSEEPIPIDLTAPARISVVEGESMMVRLDDLTDRVQRLEEDVRVEKRAKELARITAGAALTAPLKTKLDTGIGNVHIF
jgi:hypothetical protein